MMFFYINLQTSCVEGAPSEDTPRQSGTFRIINSVASAYSEKVAEQEAAAEVLIAEQQAISDAQPKSDQ